MLRHPFHGIAGSAEKREVQRQDKACEASDRRHFFGQVLAAMTGVGVWVLTRVAAAQAPWDVGRGTGFPEWGPLQGGYGGAVRPPPTASGGTVTTFALGEEGTAAPPRRWTRRRITTLAFGEEGGRVYTTYALGEEGGSIPRR